MYFTFRITKKIVSVAIGGIALLSLGALVSFNLTSRPACSDCDAIAIHASTSTPEQTQDKKIVYLTFDDGPSPTTEKILDVLKEKGVVATFFVVGDENTLPYFPLLTRAQAEGNLVALHSATHDYKQIYSSAEAFWKDLEVLRAELTPFVKNIPNIFRFPGGSSNSVSKKYGPHKIMETLKAQSLEKGYFYIDWNICVNDAVGAKKSREEIVRAAIKVGTKNSCVILFHDSKLNKNSAMALPEIIDWYKQAGFEFSTVESLNVQKTLQE